MSALFAKISGVGELAPAPNSASQLASLGTTDTHKQWKFRFGKIAKILYYFFGEEVLQHHNHTQIHIRI